MLKISKDNSGWKIVSAQHVGEKFGYNSNGQEWIRFEFYDHRRDESSLRLQVKISYVPIVETKLSGVKEIEFALE
jgi:hypothetical protein